MSTLLTLTTIAIAAWSIWTRRITWHSHWERPTTTAITLYAIGLTTFIPGPPRAILNTPLQHLTGQPQIGTLLCHMCVWAASAIMVYALLTRFTYDNLGEKYRRTVIYPLTATAIINTPIYLLGGVAATIHNPHDTAAERAYWLVSSALVIYLFTYTARALLALRRHPRHKAAADAYLLPVVAGLGGCVLVSADMLTPDWVETSCAACVCGGVLIGGLAVAAGVSWRQKTRPFQPLKTAVG